MKSLETAQPLSSIGNNVNHFSMCMYTYVCIRRYVYVGMYTYVCIRTFVYVRFYRYLGTYTTYYGLFSLN